MLELNWEEFHHIVFLKKGLPFVYSLETNLDGTKYYQITASEQNGGLQYICIINSLDDSNDVTEFENNHLADGNQKVYSNGMTIDRQLDMICLLKQICNELKLLNTKLEYVAESSIEIEDIDDFIE